MKVSTRVIWKIQQDFWRTKILFFVCFFVQSHLICHISCFSCTRGGERNKLWFYWRISLISFFLSNWNAETCPATINHGYPHLSMAWHELQSENQTTKKLFSSLRDEISKLDKTIKKKKTGRSRSKVYIMLHFEKMNERINLYRIVEIFSDFVRLLICLCAVCCVSLRVCIWIARIFYI